MDNGFEKAFGQTPKEFWDAINHPCLALYPEGHHCALMFYGDEATYNGETWMILHFQAEHAASDLLSLSKASRWMITGLRKNEYHVEGPVNHTMQAACREIAESFKILSEGVDLSIGRVHFWVTSMKCDWKFARQALSLTRHYNTHEICWVCQATTNLERPWTDLRPCADWRATFFREVPWPADKTPELMKILFFDLSYLQVDLLHVYFLGFARNLAASVLVILLKRGNIHGRNQEAKLCGVTKLFQAWCKQEKEYVPRYWKFTRRNLNMKCDEYVELKAKAAYTGAVIRWLADFVTNLQIEGANFDAVKTLVFMADRLMGYMMALRREGAHVLTSVQAEQIEIMGEAVVNLYLRCAVQPWGTGRFLLFHCRPKVHMYHHAVLLAAKQKRNPASYMTFMDENFMKEVMRVARGVHPRTSALNTLRRVWIGTHFALESFLSR